MLNELLDILDETDDNNVPSNGIDVTIFPPLNCNEDLTDEDSGTEDDPKIANVPGSQLSSEVEVAENEADKDKPDALPVIVETEPLPSSDVSSRAQNPRASKQRKIVRSYGWKKKELDSSQNNEWPEMQSCEENKVKSPLDYFKYFIDQDVLDLLVKFSN